MRFCKEIPFLQMSFSGHLLRFFWARTSFPSWSGVPWWEAAGHLHREGQDPGLWASSVTPASWHSLSLEMNSGALKSRPQHECGRSHRARTDPSFHTRTNKSHSVLSILWVWSQMGLIFTKEALALGTGSKSHRPCLPRIVYPGKLGNFVFSVGC